MRELSDRGNVLIIDTVGDRIGRRDPAGTGSDEVYRERSGT